MSEFQTYTDFENGYRLGYPTIWQRQAMAPAAMCFYAPREGPTDMFSENVMMVVEQTAASLDQYVDATVAQIQGTAGRVLVSQGNMPMAGLTARTLEFNGQAGPTMIHGRLQTYPVRWFAACVLKEGRTYTITLSAEPAAYEKYLTIVRQMVGTLELS